MPKRKHARYVRASFACSGHTPAYQWLVVLLLFGAKRIPELARGLGQGIREFKGAVDDAKQELDDAAETITSDSDKSDE